VVRRSIVEKFKADFDAFLAAYNASVLFMINPDNLDAAAALCMSVIPNLDLAKKALPKCGINFFVGEQVQPLIESYLSKITMANGAAVPLPDATHYYSFPLGTVAGYAA
jgi:hypothetical protein